MSSTAKIPIAMPKSVSARSTCSGRGAFLDEELRLVHVGEHHPVADEPGAVANDHRHFAEPLGKRHDRGQYFRRWSAAPRTTSTSRMTCAGLKKCIPTTLAGREVAAAIASMSSVEVLVASTASGFRGTVDVAEDLLLELHALEHRFDDDVGLRHAVVAERRRDRGDALGDQARA